MSEEEKLQDAVHKGVKIDEKFILSLKKEKQESTSDEKGSFKVLYFPFEWSFEEILVEIGELNPHIYNQLFIFVIEVKEINAEIQKELEKKLLKFDETRPIIIQLKLEDKNLSRLFLKFATATEFIDIEQKLHDSDKLFSFLIAIFGEKVEKFEEESINDLLKLKNQSTILKFLRTLTLTESLFEEISSNIALDGTINELLAIVDAPFDSIRRFINNKLTLKYLCTKYNDVEEPAIIQNKSKEIAHSKTYWLYEMQCIPFDNQVRISSALFKANQLDVLCVLLNNADFPFPINFDTKKFEHEALQEIKTERGKLKKIIEDEIPEEINNFIANYANLRHVYDISNQSIMNIAIDLKKYNTYYYLKSYGFQARDGDILESKLSCNEYIKAVENQRQKNIENSHKSVEHHVMVLYLKSSIHGPRLSEELIEKYHSKIKKWLSDINKIQFGSTILKTASKSDQLRIVFDFDSIYVERIDLIHKKSTGLVNNTQQSNIFIGAKLLDDNFKEAAKREQEIKGIIAHELCHYVLSMTFENDFLPYYKYNTFLKDELEMIETDINQWPTKDTIEPNDECNGIISTVFTCYHHSNFQKELIVRVMHILAEFDDNEEHTKKLRKKYSILFEFWQNHVLLELKKTNFDDRKLIKNVNEEIGFLKNISNQILELDENYVNDFKDIIETSNVKFVMTNVAKLFLIEMYQQLKARYGNLLNSISIFIDISQMTNKKFINACSNETIKIIIVDCTEGIFTNPSDAINVLKYKNKIFVVKTYEQYNHLSNFLQEKKSNLNLELREVDYFWNYLRYFSKTKLLKREIHFQNNQPTILFKILKSTTGQKKENEFREIANNSGDMIDGNFLNILTSKKIISVNIQDEKDELQLKLLHCNRNFILSNKNDQSDSLNKTIDQLIDESKQQKKRYNLISDIAGNGKSWAMKYIAMTLREQNPTHWVTYVDLKEFIINFRAEGSQSEFLPFMLNEIIRRKKDLDINQLEKKMFEKLYKLGKVFILFDGFDEIAPDCAEFVSKLAQTFQSHGGNQLWIATRDYFEVNLKKDLKLMEAYRLTEMTKEQGVDMIVRYWIHEDLKENGNIPKSREILDSNIELSPKIKDDYTQKAQLLLEKSAIFKNDKLIKNSKAVSVGLPQLFKMLAKGFKNEKDIKNLKGTKIYKEFVNVMSKRWSKGKGLIRIEANEKGQENDLNFNNFHQYHAILQLFPEYVNELFPNFDDSSWSEEEVIACGIITVINKKRYFIHETFREYFIADFILKRMKKKGTNKKVTQILVEILTVEKFGTIRMFVNDMVSDESVREKIQKELQQYTEITYKMTSFTDIFINNLINIIDFVLLIFKNGNLEILKNIVDKNIEKIAIQITNLDTFTKFIYVIFEINDSKEIEPTQQLLQKAISSILTIISDSEKNRSLNERFELIRRDFSILRKFSSDDEEEEFLNTNHKFILILTKCFTDKRITIPFKEMIKEQYLERFLMVDGDNYLSRGIFKFSSCSFNDHEMYFSYWSKEILHYLFLYNYEDVLIVKLTLKILEENLTKAQFQKILTSKSFHNMNILQYAVSIYRFKDENLKILQFLWTYLKDYFKNTKIFLNMLKEVDDYQQNILQIAASQDSIGKLEFMLTELEEIASEEEIRAMIGNDKHKSGLFVDRKFFTSEIIRKYFQ